MNEIQDIQTILGKLNLQDFPQLPALPKFEGVGVPQGEYYQHPALSNSGMSYLQKSFRKYAHYLKGLASDTDAFRVGRAYHKAILEPEKFANDFVIKQDARSKEGKALNTMHAEQGKTLLSLQEYENLQGIREVLYTNKDLQDLLTPCEYEVKWLANVDGISAKGMADAVHSNGEYFIDLKFVLDASPEVFGSKLFAYNYDRQMAWYREGLIANGHLNPDAKTYIIAIEKQAPFDFCIYEISDATLQAGTSKWLDCLELYKQFLSYDSTSLPSYEKTTI